MRDIRLLSNISPTMEALIGSARLVKDRGYSEKTNLGQYSW